MSFVARAVQKGTVTQDDLTNFAKGTKQARHLFDDKIKDLCDTIYKEGVNVMIGHELMDKGTSPDHQKTVEAWGKRMMWFTELLDSLPKEFDRFLKV